MIDRKLAALGAGMVLALAWPGDGMAQPATTQTQLDELRRLIQQQQQVIQELERRVQDLQVQTVDTQKQASEAASSAETARQAVVDKPLVTGTQPKVKLAVTGWVNRMVNLADDGDKTKAYFVDNNVSQSRLRIFGTAQVSDDVSIGSNIEIGIAPNVSNQVSQTNEVTGDSFNQRKVEALFTSKAYGTVLFGKGDPSSKDIARIDLSGTDVLATANPADVAGGLFFVNDGDDTPSGITIGNVFSDLDLGRINRIRYDTPAFLGATLSATYGEDQKSSAALKWGGTGYGFRGAAGLGISDPSNQGVDYTVAGSAALRHEATGLNVAVGSAVQQADGSDPTFYYVKGGWLAKLVPIGTSAFSLDYGRYDDRVQGEATGSTIGLAAVQSLADYGTELYAGFRMFDLDRDDGPSTSEIYVGTFGTRVKF